VVVDFRQTRVGDVDVSRVGGWRLSMYERFERNVDANHHSSRICWVRSVGSNRRLTRGIPFSRQSFVVRRVRGV
jgi:hypothetical protein